MNGVLFDGWDAVGRTIVIGLCAYISLIALLRVSGKRTLSKMNAFDWVVTVSLGSALASIIVSKGVALAEGIVALAMLIGLQFVVTWTSVRVGWVRRMLTGEPKLLLDQGRMLHDAMHSSRISEGEVLAAVRSAGLRDLESVAAVVLETDGSLSVIKRQDGGTMSSLADVQ